MMLLIFIFLARADAYEEIFRLNTPEQIRKYEVSVMEDRVMAESCRLEKLRKGFLWPCYLMASTELSVDEMISECRVKVGLIYSAQRLPKAKNLRGLPKECQLLIQKRRQVLAYKAIGI